MVGAHETVPAAGEHTVPPHMEAERPSTPQPTDFHPVRGACIPPRNKIDRSNRIRRPVLKLRPDAGVRKHHQAFRSLGQVGSVLHDSSAPPRSSCHMFNKLPSFFSCGRAGVGATLPESGIWLQQAVAHCDARDAAEQARNAFRSV
ncbi:hypothetical protein T484DRAFT_1881447 [Baffinella frigidus]|nr:hypothetical protein T484DRAFT_1881447 [Cryptophyta sp. CCMP2293]